MSYHSGGVGVATNALITAARKSARKQRREREQREQLHRDRFRGAGLELDALFREEVTNSSHECDEIPAPKQLIKDIAPTRQRAASIVTIGMAIAALAFDPTTPDGRLERIAVRFAGWVHSLRPVGTDTLAVAWSRETRSQANADILQADAVHAVERRDLVAIRRAIDGTAAEITEKQAFLARLKQAEREVLNAQLTGMKPRTVLLAGVGRNS